MNNDISFQGSQQRNFMGHPIGLTICFLTEMWERFSYYGMRTILVLYLVKYHLYSAEQASFIYGAYAGLVYMMPIIGGFLADRYLGARKGKCFIFSVKVVTFAFDIDCPWPN